MIRVSANEIIADFVLDHAPVLDVSRRARLYRAVAEVIGDEKDAQRFTSLAKDLEEFERKHGQLALNFKRRAL